MKYELERQATIWDVIKYLILVTLVCFAAAALVGCRTPTIQKQSVNALFTIGKSVNASLDTYLDLVNQRVVSTNGVPAVLRSYDNFQKIYVAAVIYVAGNTNSLVPLDVSIAADNFSRTITAEGGKQR